MSGPDQHFYFSILDACRYVIIAKLSERKGFLGAEYVDFTGSLHYLPRPTCGNEIKCCDEPFCVGVFGTDSFLARPRRKTFLVVFVVGGVVMVTCSGSALLTPCSMSGIFLNLLILCLWIVATGPDVFFGMVGCL